MATLGQVGEAITEQLHERVDSLVAAIEADAPDFGEIARVADALGELTDTVADIYTDLERRLLDGLRGESGSDGDDGESQPKRRREAPRQRQQPAHRGSSDEEATKEELLEQARELHVEGRSSMTKDELAQAVEAEESVTKEELLDRARDAGIEGRSSMTKEELREALHTAGA